MPNETEKVQRLLLILIQRLFDQELRIMEMQGVLFTEEQRSEMVAGHLDALEEFGEEALAQYFRGLRRQAGEIMEPQTSDASNASSAALWAALRHADRQESDGEFVQEEWRKLWDVL